MNEKELPVDKVEVGTELASNVVNKYNQVLISAGSRFEEKHRFLLKTWGIKQVKVKIESENKNFSFSEEQKLEALNELKERMFWSPRNDIETELVQIAVERICKSKAAIK